MELRPGARVQAEGIEPCLAVLVERDAEDAQAAILVLSVELAHVGEAGDAGAAPRGPEVQQDVVAAVNVVREAVRLTEAVGGREVAVGYARHRALLLLAPVARPRVLHRGMVGIGGILAHKLLLLRWTERAVVDVEVVGGDDVVEVAAYVLPPRGLHVGHRAGEALQVGRVLRRGGGEVAAVHHLDGLLPVLVEAVPPGRYAAFDGTLPQLALDEAALQRAARHLARGEVDVRRHVIDDELEVVVGEVAYLQERVSRQAALKAEAAVLDGYARHEALPVGCHEKPRHAVGRGGRGAGDDEVDAVLHDGREGLRLPCHSAEGAEGGEADVLEVEFHCMCVAKYNHWCRLKLSLSKQIW